MFNMSHNMHWRTKRRELQLRQEREADTSLPSPELLDRKLWQADFSYYCKYGDAPYKDWTTYAWTMEEVNEHAYIRLKWRHDEEFDNADEYNKKVPLKGQIFPDGGGCVLTYSVEKSNLIRLLNTIIITHTSNLKIVSVS